ncbi:MAG: HNH endonuclease [Sideroxydans sp.]|nr:HNH endonuclease [Sideroxydans sp.]
MNKVSIPKELAAQILFDSDRTCCVCRVRGRHVQLHHIDEDNSNNDPSNIAVLCFDCHRDTQITGGFDRKLDAHQIVIYRDDWIKRIRNRRVSDHGPEEISPQVKDPLLKLIMSLPDGLLRSYRLAQPKWDTGIPSAMHEGNIDMIWALKHILVDLVAFYPPSHFEGKLPEDYFREKIDSLFDWHSKRFDLEGSGPGTVGGLVIVGGEVISDLEKMVAEMVRSLTSHRDNFNFQAWLSEWKNHSS